MYSGGFFHVASSLLEKLDHVQNRFLRELNVSPCQAFLEFNFAPPSLRRNIGALGLLHKHVLGKVHPTFEKLLSWYTERFPEANRTVIINNYMVIIAKSDAITIYFSDQSLLYAMYIIIFRSMWWI